jgi:hypothetical protein
VVHARAKVCLVELWLLKNLLRVVGCVKATVGKAEGRLVGAAVNCSMCKKYM